MGGKASAAELWPQPTVTTSRDSDHQFWGTDLWRAWEANNFAGARAPQQDLDGFRDSFPLSVSSVFPPRRVRSANDKSLKTTLSLLTGPPGGA